MTPENESKYWRSAESAALDAEQAVAHMNPAAINSIEAELVARAKELRDKADAFLAAMVRNSGARMRATFPRQMLPIREAFLEWDVAIASGLPDRCD